MLGESLQISLHQFSEVALRPAQHDDVQVLPGFVLPGLRPDLPVHRVRQEIRARELRIFGITAIPITQRFFREIHLRDEMRVRRVGACADRVVVERIVDPEKAHLEPPEIFVTRGRDFHHLELMLAKF